ncbi:ABC transporter substrate-binding protein [Chelativorans salis]|uniref:ABC transporter substrate-binding protein n=1 Tax=Chelativorans salis TaxID=2978478 RepID=A0ABT2LRF0_9HYPH|nr:ABC transporter substrate-binding protein [Chelativorans sp. EGI FJ00035]MCT7376664.1 ABC transporter substrate-binding protein [Chelativorans sp. EGI FJ00035]
MKLTAILSNTAFGLVMTATAHAQEVTIYCDDIGFGCKTMAPVAERFNEEHPGKTVKLETVSYQTVVEALPVQLESGEGPDAAIITDLGGLSRYYVDLTPYVDAANFEKEFGQTLQWLRGTDGKSKAINGMPTSLTVNGAYVNLTLFEQAGVSVPEEGATWDEWAEAARKVAEATNTEFPMEMDRSGHRFASFAISHGAELVDEEGNPVVDDGLHAAIDTFVEWHKNGTMPLDLWGAVGGSTHRELFEDFLNANVVFYFGGSWTLSRMDTEVGDLFEWAVVDTPCGPSSCTAMPGGGALVGFKHTPHPELVGEYIDYVAQQENYKEIIAAAVEIPAATSLIEEGVDYPTASERTQVALRTFMDQIPKMAPAAYRFQGWRYQRAMMNALTTRISQVINDELTVEAALERIRQDVELAIQAAEAK